MKDFFFFLQILNYQSKVLEHLHLSGNDFKTTSGQTLSTLALVILKLNLKTIDLSDCNMDLTNDFDTTSIAEFANAIKSLQIIGFTTRCDIKLFFIYFLFRFGTGEFEFITQ
jgi:hypothetical protein